MYGISNYCIHIPPKELASINIIKPSFLLCLFLLFIQLLLVLLRLSVTGLHRKVLYLAATDLSAFPDLQYPNELSCSPCHPQFMWLTMMVAMAGTVVHYIWKASGWGN